MPRPVFVSELQLHNTLHKAVYILHFRGPLSEVGWYLCVILY